MKSEHTVAVMALIVVIAAASTLLGSGLTGNAAFYVKGTLIGFRPTIEAPSLNEALYIGENFAKGSANTCMEEMRYLGRVYNRYVRCCQAECTPKCKDAEVASHELDDCIQQCANTCVDIMTHTYLNIQPGTWR